jgi:hypothetical protein
VAGTPQPVSQEGSGSDSLRREVSEIVGVDEEVLADYVGDWGLTVKEARVCEALVEAGTVGGAVRVMKERWSWVVTPAWIKSHLEYSKVMQMALVKMVKDRGRYEDLTKERVGSIAWEALFEGRKLSLVEVKVMEFVSKLKGFYKDEAINARVEVNFLERA